MNTRGGGGGYGDSGLEHKHPSGSSVPVGHARIDIESRTFLKKSVEPVTK